MRLHLIVLILALVLLGPPVHAQQPQAEIIVTTGQGVIQATPDRAWITVSAETRGANPREAQRRNVEAMRPVQDALRNARISSDAVRTAGYDLQQDVEFVNNRRVVRGYVARNTIEIRVDDVTRLGEVLELAVGQGATNVGGLRFDLKDQAKLERDALRQAVADARAKAEAVAAGAGRAVDRVLRVEEAGAVQAPPMPMFRGMAQAASAEAPPIAAGQIEIRAQVTVTSALK
ncbi:MAG TPA: SIMPL domain-containing protein [Vicinamibacterales bacterium]